MVIGDESMRRWKVILKCNCHSEFQDEEHGPGKRVHNFNGKGNPGQANYRCTVCGNMREGRGGAAQQKNQEESHVTY